ncbi:hypothetical protein LCI18_006900 [Fusarium solani-melongenae]|uniref:Uncharacterized protein n=1 Tax=Fusarium solani subsp. cucurbitae TaxID=2747967 RepID=A0ACD3Z4C7_FUSSC|nr:hypothetical protein LCI18_006900 [Fusarium solani-melongenae]
MYASHQDPTSGIGAFQQAGPDLNAIEVDTYQIAVPNGDCSVHLLVQRTAFRQGKILKSILMDGGNDGSSSAENAANIIEKSLKMIRARYDPEGSQEIQFDAWVVTHWDNDHWAGSLRMFQRSMDDNGQSARMKYEGNKPLSHLYCPNWVGLPKYPAVPELPKTNLLKKRPDVLSIQDDDKSHFDEERGTGQVYFKTRIQDGCPLCIAKWGHRQILGTDFFTGDFLWHYLNQGMDKSADNARQKVLGTVANMKTVVKLSNVRDTKYPRFVCIGVGGFVFGSKVDEEALRAALATKKMTLADTWANMSSIMSVLFFPEAAHLSLYWGGDSITPVELPLAQSSFFDGHKCSVTKWSHHGGRHSSPEELWRKLEPKNCVVSPNRTGQYLHPHCGLEKINGKNGLKQLQLDWHAVSPLLPQSLACPTYVYMPQTNDYDFHAKGYKLPAEQGKPPTKRSTWQIQFIHILSSAEPTRDGTISPFAVAYKLTKASSTTLAPKNKITIPIFNPSNIATTQIVDDDNDPATDYYDAILSDQLEDQWARDYESGMIIEKSSEAFGNEDVEALKLFNWDDEQLSQPNGSQQFSGQQQVQEKPAYLPGYGQSQPNHNQQGNSSQYSNPSYNQQPGDNHQSNFGQYFSQSNSQSPSQIYNYQPTSNQNNKQPRK